MITSLTLIGTQHYDAKGNRRLTKLLTHLQPDVVTMETCPEVIANIEQRIAEQKDPWFLMGIAAYAKEIKGNYSGMKYVRQMSGYEYVAARDYCTKQGIPLIPADPLLYQYVNSSPTFGAACNELDKMSETEIRAWAERTYSTCIKVPDPQEIPEMQRRDAAMEEIIRRQNGRVAHIGGLMHLYADYSNLFQRLKDLKPERMKLNAADKL